MNDPAQTRRRLIGLIRDRPEEILRTVLPVLEWPDRMSNLIRQNATRRAKEEKRQAELAAAKRRQEEAEKARASRRRIREELRRKWQRAALSTEPMDWLNAERAARACYTAAGMKPPKQVRWCASPQAALRQAAVHNIESLFFASGVGSNRYCAAKIADAFQSSVDRPAVLVASEGVEGWHEMRQVQRQLQRTVDEGVQWIIRRAYDRPRRWFLLGGRWPRDPRPMFADIAFAEYVRRTSGRPDPIGEALCIVAENVGAMIPQGDVCYLVARPTVIRTDDQGRAHCDSGPAIQYGDGSSIYCWRGLRAPRWVVMNPERITMDKILSAPTSDVRRIMIERVGSGRFIEMSGATRVAEDETGILWTWQFSPRQRWAAVEVLNGTPEPDGSYRHFFLQVPPWMRSARQAVAWTYGLDELQYMALRQRT